MVQERGRVVVTGVSGLVGFHLAERLCRSAPDQTVVGISRSSNSNVEELSHLPNFRFVSQDLLATPDLHEALAGAGLIYHLAAQSAIYRARQDPISDLRTNTEGSLQLLLAAARAGVSKVIYTSGAAVYRNQAHAREEDVGQPPSFYGTSKLAAESYVRLVSSSAGMRHTILRLARVYGPRMVRGAIYDLIHDFQARRPANMFAHPGSVFDFIYVKDVVSALVLAAGERWDGVTANIGGGSGIRLTDLHAALGEIFGYAVPLAEVDASPSVEALVTDRARSLGWQPRYSLEEGLIETFRYFVRPAGD